MSILHKLEWRYATKKFNLEKKVSEENITELLKAINLTASAYGLQPFEFIVAQGKEIQKKLSLASFNQPQIMSASHIVVIAAKSSIDRKYIDDYIERVAEIRKQNISDLDGYKKMLLDTTQSWSEQESLTWAQKQCYIVLGTLLLAAADLKIDACPMEGFSPDDYDEILDLKNQGLRATLVVPIGYRADDDEYQHLSKSRRHLDDIVDLRYSQ